VNPVPQSSAVAAPAWADHASSWEIVLDARPRGVDELTGLPGRSGMRTALDAAATTGSVAVLFVDLDHFKRINDTRGHQAGDHLLMEFARRLRTAVAPSSTVARFGGDEFVVVAGGSMADRPLDIAERVLAAARHPFTIDGAELVVSASVGVTSARCPTGPVDADALMQEADIALFEAKRLGRGRAAHFTDDLRRRVVDRVEMEHELREALRSSQLCLEYQPQVDLLTGRIVAVEALARWRRDDGTPVAPPVFIGIAEESGLIHELGRWAIDAACARFSTWSQRFARPPAVLGVNLSPYQLRDASLVSFVSAVLARNGVAPTALCLELTESGFEGLDEELAVLDALRNLGCYIAIDDFGTGYSSLARLRDLPVEILKIDRSFIRGLGTDADDTAIVSAVMSLALTLGLHVVAEGVERPEQAGALTRLGCPVAQGYLFAPPAAPSDFAALLTRNRLWRPIVGDEAASDQLGPAGGAGDRRGHRSFIHEFLHQIGLEVRP
jgi:diguanylate cyclase (GGDEF)-like protein